MNYFSLRQFRIWLISIAVLIVIFLIYGQLNKTARIEVVKESKSEVAEEQFGDKIGMVGDVGVKEATRSRYTDYKDGRLVGEFGFARLLYESASEWKIERPYRNIFRPEFNCFITADEGSVSIEPGANKPNPRDATLSGNVVIHIEPEPCSEIKQCDVYLDDISFVSDRSLFFTSGPVRFASQDAQMTGRGLEIVYNEELERLEYLKIIELEKLILRTSSDTALFSPKSKTDDSEAEKPATEQRQTNDSKANQTEDLYRCAFQGNVVIDSNQQVVFAQQIFINDIGLPGSKEKTEDSQTDTGWQATADGNKPDEAEGYFDVVITCDDGIVVRPMDAEFEPYVSAAGSGKVKTTQENKIGRTEFAADRIDYSVKTESITAGGASELSFFVKSFGGEGKSGQKDVPVKITAQKKVSFSSSSNRAVFEGESICTMVVDDLGVRQEHKLSGDKIVVDLNDSTSEVRTVRAEGQVVRLSSVKKAGKDFLGGVELKCRQLDFDNSQQMVVAKGQGVIVVDNSKLTERRRRGKTGKFSLQKRCYALVEGFDTLKYFLASDRIVAEAAQQQLGIGYIPIVRGENGQATKVTANRLEAELMEIAGGKKDLARLDAIGGITYEDGRQQFVGSELYYNGEKSLITARGNDIWPCLLNGVPVEGIRYNLKSSRAGRAKIVGPGLLRK